MGITNRAMDASEQRRVFQSSYGAVATGATLHVAAIPFACTLDGIKLAVAGLSGSPTYAAAIWRFIPGTGVTTITAGFTTLTGVAMGTSGVQTFVSVASGNTLLNLLANDVVTITSGAANTAVTNLTAAVVVKAVQDIKTSFGY